MNLSAFASQSNFDEVEWINALFKGIQKNQKEQIAQDALAKLEGFSKEVNSSIENVCHSIKSNMPLVGSETKNLKMQAVAVKTKMSELERDISKTESAFSMANLERLDNLKTKLQAAKNFLEQNDTFSKLQEELEDILESENKDMENACDKLAMLNNSFEAQKGLPGEGDRELKLEEFKNRVEAELAGHVVKVLNDGNVEESLKYVRMFKKIDRLAQMKNYYGSLQRENYMRNWVEIISTVENTENSRFLTDFYDTFLNNWAKQLRWHKDVFNVDGIQETIQVIIDTLSSLNPTRESIISSYLKRINSNEKMELLQEISQSNVRFASEVVKRIEESSVTLSADKMSSLSHSIFNYFNIFIVHYSSLEQASLDSNFDSIKTIQTNGGDTVRSLENAVPKVFEWIDKAIDRQSLITQDCAFISLIYILNTFLKKFLDKFKKAQLQLDASRSDHQDWNLLQICISLLQNIGSFKVHLDSIESKIQKLMIAKSKTENELFCYKMVGQRDIHDFKKYLGKVSTSNGEIVVFDSSLQSLVQIAKDCHEMLLRNVFSPIDGYFKKLEVNGNNSSSSADLPDFSLTPCHYITEIGQFLVTLPQHLEPLLLQPSNPLKVALELSDESYKENIPGADVLLSIIADETCSVYGIQIRQITSITDGEAKQLATDIEYLGSVLEELGFTLSSHLKQTIQLLKAKPQNYMTASVGVDHKLIAAIRQMRNINVSNES